MGEVLVKGLGRDPQPPRYFGLGHPGPLYDLLDQPIHPLGVREDHRDGGGGTNVGRGGADWKKQPI